MMGLLDEVVGEGEDCPDHIIDDIYNNISLSPTINREVIGISWMRLFG